MVYALSMTYQSAFALSSKPKRPEEDGGDRTLRMGGGNTDSGRPEDDGESRIEPRPKDDGVGRTTYSESF